MTAKKQSPDAPATTAAQYRQHFRDHRAALSRYDEAMDSPESVAAWAALSSALERVRADYPGEAEIIEAATQVIDGKWHDACGALIDAWYHECERRVLAPSLVATKKATRKARLKWEGDPTARAKADAVALWPTAQRQGWTAVKLHAELAGKGHAVPFDTVRKWATKLRKTGAC